MSFNIAAGGVGPTALAVDPSGKFAYVANEGCPDAFAGNAAKFVLILKRLCDLEFPEGHFFSDRVQQKRSRQTREPC